MGARGHDKHGRRGVRAGWGWGLREGSRRSWKGGGRRGRSGRSGRRARSRDEEWIRRQWGRSHGSSGGAVRGGWGWGLEVGVGVGHDVRSKGPMTSTGGGAGCVRGGGGGCGWGWSSSRDEEWDQE